MHIIPSPRGFVYLASPIGTYRTGRYDRMLSAVRDRFPRHHILAARDLGFTSATWLPRWRRLLPKLDRIVAFSDSSGIIGAGVFWEVFDARLRGLPVHFLTKKGRLVPLRHLLFQFLRGGDLRRFARVIYTLPGQRSRRGAI